MNKHIFGEDEYLSSIVIDRVQDMDNVTKAPRNVIVNIVPDFSKSFQAHQLVHEV